MIPPSRPGLTSMTSPKHASATDPPRMVRRVPLWGAFLCLMVPGLGQVYAQRRLAGFSLVGASCALAAIHATLSIATERMTAPVLAIMVLCALLFLSLEIGSTIHAWLAIRRRREVPRPNPLPSGWLFVTLALGVFACVVAGEWSLTRWTAYVIPSDAMSPTLEAGDRMLAHAVSPSEFMPRRGDLVVFTVPGTDLTSVKRVVGLPGDRVQMRGGQLLLNRKPVPRTPRLAGGLPVRVAPDGEGDAALCVLALPGNGRQWEVLKRTDSGWQNNTAEVLVPPGQLFVLGDNLDDSRDSRIPPVASMSPDSLGLLPIANVLGQPDLVDWARDWRRIGTDLR